MRYEHDAKQRLVKTASTFHEYVQLANEFKDPDASSCKVRKSSTDFYGDALTFEEMYERCYDGYNAKAIGEQRRKIADLFQYERATDELRVCGEALDVPTYLSGEPKCFWQSSTEERKARVHIAYASNCTGGHGAQAFLNHGGAIAVLCDIIADQADTKITCYVSNTHVFAGKGLSAITIKDYNESVDIPRIGATTHPSFFRRIGFAWLEGFGESVGKPEWEGYGCSMTGRDRKAVISDEEFAEWLRVEKDEIVIDLPAADLPCFTDEHRTAVWLSEAVEKIKSAIANKINYIQLFN